MIEAILKIEVNYKLVQSHWIDEIAVYWKKHFLVTMAIVAKKNVFVLKIRNVNDIYVWLHTTYKKV